MHDASGAAVELVGDPRGPLLARVGGGYARVLSGVLRPGAADLDGSPVDVVLQDLDGAARPQCPAGQVARVGVLPDGLLSDAARPLVLDDPDGA